MLMKLNLKNLSSFKLFKSFKTGLKYVNKFSSIKRFSENLKFSSPSDNNKFSQHIPKLEILKDLPNYIEKELTEDSVKANLIKKKLEENKQTNSLYQKFFEINNNMLKNDSSFLSNFKINSSDITREQTLKEIKLSYPDSEVQNAEIKKLVDIINLQANQIFINNEEAVSFKENLNSLFEKLEEELKSNEKIESLLLEQKRIITFLKNLNSISPSKVGYPLIQHSTNRFLKLLINFNEIPLEIIKSNEMFLWEVIEAFYHQRDKFGKLINTDNFNNNIKTVLENFIIILTKYSGNNSTDVANNYYILSSFYLKNREFDKSEDYALKSLEILNSLKETNRDINSIQPYYILSEINSEHHRDYKETYVLLNECLNLLKENKNKLDDKLEILKVKILNRLSCVYSLVGGLDTTKSKLDLLDYFFKNANWSLVQKYPSLLHIYLDLLLEQGELFHKSEFYKKSYDCYKKAFDIFTTRTSDADHQVYSYILNKLVSLFKYSDDFNSNLNYLSREAKTNEMKEYKNELLNFILTLITHSIKNKNFKSAKFLCEIIETNTLKKKTTGDNIPDESYLIKYYSSSFMVKKNFYELDSSINEITKALGFIYNSQELRSDNKSKFEKLIKYHFNLAYVHLLQSQANKVIENFETCVKFINELEAVTQNKEDMNIYYNLLGLIYSSLANFYLVANERIKASLQLTRINELIKKMNSKDVRAKNITAYADEIKKEQNK